METPKPRPPTGPPAALPPRRKILIIDDDELICATIRMALELRDFHCLETNSAETGLALARQELPDLILCDLHMTGRTGLELLEELRRDIATAAIPFILITGDQDSRVLRRSMQMGADDFLYKTFSAQELILAVESRLNRHALVKAQVAQMTVDQLRQLSRAVEQSPVSIMITDPAGRIEYVNPKFTQVSGYSLAEVAGKNPRFLKSGETTREEYGALWNTITHGGEWRGEFHNRRKNGELFWEQASISGIVNDAGKITHFLAVKEDITAHKQAERERLTLQLELEQARRLESLGRLAAGIAHEINTPTQYIADNLHFLTRAATDVERLLEHHTRLVQALRQQGALPAEVQEILTAIDSLRLDFIRQELPQAIHDAADGVERVTNIVRAMKNFSHPGRGKKCPVDLNRAIDSTITVSRHEWKYVAELETDLAPDLPPVPCLPVELNQVILNLVVNAAHAIAEAHGGPGGARGRITVSTRAIGDWVEIRIADNGTGIPEQVRPHIFEPFFTTKGIGKGTGQGLALARAIIVERHGGTIEFETESGKGTTFCLRLPLVYPEPPALNPSQIP